MLDLMHPKLLIQKKLMTLLSTLGISTRWCHKSLKFYVRRTCQVFKRNDVKTGAILSANEAENVIIAFCLPCNCENSWEIPNLPTYCSSHQRYTQRIEILTWLTDDTQSLLLITSIMIIALKLSLSQVKFLLSFGCYSTEYVLH